MRLSFITPVYNEIAHLAQLTAEIAKLTKAGHEVIVVDGGSNDGTYEKLQDTDGIIMCSEKGRAIQMNRGAEHATGEVLVFLHADTTLPDRAAMLIEQAIQQRPWGRFDVALSGDAMLLRIIARMMNIRSCITAIATGDQCIFVRRELFESLGGYQTIPLMEDIRISKSLKQVARPFCIPAKVTTSSRRWETKGIMRTILLMWFLRLAYFLGVSPQHLHDVYYSK